MSTQTAVPPPAEKLILDPADAATPAVSRLRGRAGRLMPADAVPESLGRATSNGEASGPSTPPKAAAVLVAIGCDEAGVPALLLTVRSPHLTAHAGQVALPGGKIEMGETPAQAALREAHEEVDLPPGAATVLGVADTYLTRTGFAVVPVLAILHQKVQLHANPSEVAGIFAAPVDDVMEGARWQEGQIVHRGMVHTYFETISQGQRIWGVTAGILRLVHHKLYGP